MVDMKISERNELALTSLRLRNGDAAHAHLEEVLGVALPTVPNTVSVHGTTRICWSAPGEWLLISEAPLDLARISSACGAVLHHVCDVTHGRTVLELEGRLVREVIATSCSLDLHDRMFPPNHCATTIFGQIGAMIVRRDDTFMIVIDASYARHLKAWLSKVAN